MKRKVKLAANPKAFLARVGRGPSLADFKTNQRIFSPGNIADAIFFIQTGQVKLTVLSKGRPGSLQLIAERRPARLCGLIT